MKVLSLIIAFSMVAASVADAQVTGRIRAGEHGSYTRVTIPMEKGTQWGASSGDRVIIIQFAELESMLSLDELFRRIGRNRVANVRFKDNEVVIELACDCGFRAFLESESLLVIDISERFPPVRDPSIVGSDSNTGLIGNQIQLGTGIGGLLGIGRSRDLQRRLDQKDMPFESFIAWPDMQSNTPSKRGSGGKENGPLNGLNELIKLAIDADYLRGEQRVPFVVEYGSDNRVEAGENMQISGPLAEIDIVSPDVDAPLNNCPPEGDYDVSSWSFSDGFTFGLGELSSQIYGEFDVVSEESVVKLARHFAYYGFGAEALGVLQLLVSSDPRTLPVYLISQLIEDGNPSDSYLIFEPTCGEMVAFWHFLADPRKESPILKDESALAFALSTLPDHLQSDVLQLFVSRLEGPEFQYVAKPILQRMRGLGFPSGTPLVKKPEVINLSSQPLHQEGPVSYFKDLANSYFRQPSPDIVERIVAENFWQHRLEMEELDALGSIAFQNRQSSSANALQSHFLLGLVYSGFYQQAMLELGMSDEILDEPTSNDIYSQIFEKLAVHGDDEPFLILALNSDHQRMNFNSLIAVANRLLELGFDRQAYKYVQAATGWTSPEERVELEALREKVLLSLKSKNADGAAINDFDLATSPLETQQRLNEQGNFGNESFSNQDPVDLNTSNDSVPVDIAPAEASGSSVASQGGGQNIASSNEVGVLQHASDLLTNSQKTRLSAEQLMKDTYLNILEQ